MLPTTLSLLFLPPGAIALYIAFTQVVDEDTDIAWHNVAAAGCLVAVTVLAGLSEKARGASRKRILWVAGATAALTLAVAGGLLWLFITSTDWN